MPMGSRRRGPRLLALNVVDIVRVDDIAVVAFEVDLAAVELFDLERRFSPGFWLPNSTSESCTCHQHHGWRPCRRRLRSQWWPLEMMSPDEKGLSVGVAAYDSAKRDRRVKQNSAWNMRKRGVICRHFYAVRELRRRRPRVGSYFLPRFKDNRDRLTRKRNAIVAVLHRWAVVPCVLGRIVSVVRTGGSAENTVCRNIN